VRFGFTGERPRPAFSHVWPTMHDARQTVRALSTGPSRNSRPDRLRSKPMGVLALRWRESGPSRPTPGATGMRANTAYSPKAWRTGQIDPLLPSRSILRTAKSPRKRSSTEGVGRASTALAPLFD
jgi:hypothetical protein